MAAGTFEQSSYRALKPRAAKSDLLLLLDKLVVKHFKLATRCVQLWLTQELFAGRSILEEPRTAYEHNPSSQAR